ncbi:acyltransferase domain-containing protein, partial [Komagataeibacter intermedius]
MPVVEALMRSSELIVLSAQSERALDIMAARLVDYVRAHPALSLRDIACGLASTQSHYNHRLALPVGTHDEFVSSFESASRGKRVRGLSRECVSPGRQTIVFVFPGQGPQWFGMGRELLVEEPAFREALEECAAAIEAETGWSVIDELKRPPETSRLERIEFAQPALFSVEVALGALWRSWGVEPDVVVGHSIGEVAAAYMAGAVTLADAAKVICRQSRLLERIHGKGELALVRLPAEEVVAALSGLEEEWSIAAINSRTSTVISGNPAAVSSILRRLHARGVPGKRVKVEVPAHSPQMDVLREDLLSALAEVAPQHPRVSMRSTVTGHPVGDGELTGAYWTNNLRQPVRFADVIESLLAEGHGIFVEVSPHPVLLPALEELRSRAGSGGATVGSLYRGRPERRSMLASAGRIFALGGKLDLTRIYPESSSSVELSLSYGPTSEEQPAALASDRHGMPAELASLSERDRQGAVLEMVRGEAALVLSLPAADDVEAERPLKEVGLDSLRAIELRDGLARLIGMTLPATLAFDHPTPMAIAKYLIDKVFFNAESSPPVVALSAASAPDEPIAIVGIGCRYPGGVS